MVFKKQLSEKLSYAFEQTFGVTEENADPALFGPTAKWYGLDQYLFYTINPLLVGGRPRGVFPRPGRDAGRRLGQRGYRRLAGSPRFRGHVHGGLAGAELASQPQRCRPARGPLGLL